MHKFICVTRINVYKFEELTRMAKRRAIAWCLEDADISEDARLDAVPDEMMQECCENNGWYFDYYGNHIDMDRDDSDWIECKY